jgi:uncharacterized membrane protein YhaH (DUF805 family)
MGRLVVAKATPGVRAKKAGDKPEEDDGYLGRVAKYVPSEVLAAYLAINGIVTQPDVLNQGWTPYMNVAVFIIGLLVIPSYLMARKAKDKQPAVMHSAISMLAFVVWTYAIEGAVYTNNIFHADVHETAIGSIALIIFTLVSGAMQPQEGQA